MNKKVTIASVLASMLAPVMASAAGASILPLPGVLAEPNIFVLITAIFTIIWPIFAAFAVLMFIYAGFQFLNARGGDTSEARMAVVWGMVGVGVGLLAFSIPFIIKELLGV